MTKRLCCYILDQKTLKRRCQNTATFEIWYGENPTPDDYSDSCDKHLVDLLDDSQTFTLNRIPPQE